MTDEELIDRLREGLAVLHPPTDLIQELRRYAGDQSPSNRSRGSREHGRRGASVLLAVGSAVAIMVAAVALISSGSNVMQPPTPLGHSRVPDSRRAFHSALPPALRPAHPSLRSQVAVFTRPATTVDALSSGDRRYLDQEYRSEQPDFADSRRVTASDGQTAYLIPAKQGVCVLNTNGSEAFCMASASWPGANAAHICGPTVPAGSIEVEWLLPDGATHIALATSSATVRTFAPGFNVYIATLAKNEPLPTSIEWNDPASRHHAVASAIPPGTQSTKCAPSPPGGAATSAQNTHNGLVRQLITRARKAAKALGDPHVPTALVVKTTKNAAESWLEAHAVPSAEPDPAAYVIVLHGDFTCDACSVPPGVSAPQGHSAQFIWIPGRTGGSFGLSRTTPSGLGKLGAIIRLSLH